MSDGLRTRLRQDWMDALQDFTIPEVRAAIAAALEESPKEATNEGRIKARIVADRGRRLLSLPKPIDRDESDRRPPAHIRAAQAAELLGSIKRMGDE